MADNKKFADYLRQLQEAQFPRWPIYPNLIFTWIRLFNM